MDNTFMRIIPQEMGHACIISDMKRSDEVRDEIQWLAHDIYVALNESPEHIFIAFNPEAKDIEVHSVFGMDKKFKYDVIVSPYDDSNYLMEYLCSIGRGTISRRLMN